MKYYEGDIVEILHCDDNHKYLGIFVGHKYYVFSETFSDIVNVKAELNPCVLKQKFVTLYKSPLKNRIKRLFHNILKKEVDK